MDLRKTHLTNCDKLFWQLDLCKDIQCNLRTIVIEFLIGKGVYTLDDVNEVIKEEYYDYISQMQGISVGQKIYYRNILNRAMLAYLMTFNEELVFDVDFVIPETPIRNKVLLFLLEHGVSNISEIDYDLREKFKSQLFHQKNKKIREYVKALDKLKLHSIERNKAHPLISQTINYSNQKIFLLYHPDYDIAMSFYYVRNKEELLFDFSLNASEHMKRQIFIMLCYILEERHDRHDRRERFLNPLKQLYLFCVENDIKDIEKITQKQIYKFRETMEQKVELKNDKYMQIISNTRKYLFLQSKTINWSATTWYLQRFEFKEERMNMAREIKSINFGQIENEENRVLFQKYMEYLLGIAQKLSIQTIRQLYYNICDFLKFCDNESVNCVEISKTEMEKYINCLDEKNMSESTFNRRISAVGSFFNYHIQKKQIDKIPIQIDYYLKNELPYHKDRFVKKEHQMEIYKLLKEIPFHLRLMFLTLSYAGIRVSEVCILKPRNFEFDGDVPTLKIYQSKMKSEKICPIPVSLYELMKKFIDDNKIEPGEYIFKDKNGGAYDASTFSKQMKKYLKNAKLEEYQFKSHDFRHTVATTLYDEYDLPLGVIRDYLGHKTIDMTKQYVDYMPKRLKEANGEFFRSVSD